MLDETVERKHIWYRIFLMRKRDFSQESVSYNLFMNDSEEIVMAIKLLDLEIHAQTSSICNSGRWYLDADIELGPRYWPGGVIRAASRHKRMVFCECLIILIPFTIHMYFVGLHFLHNIHWRKGIGLCIYIIWKSVIWIYTTNNCNILHLNVEMDSYFLRFGFDVRTNDISSCGITLEKAELLYVKEDFIKGN
jgi:hypothetical protein